MRNGNLLLNIFIYYFILNLISCPFLFGYLHFYEKYPLSENHLISGLTLAFFIGWYVLLLTLTHMSARQSAHYGKDTEDAIKEAVKEIIMYVRLALPF